MSNNGGVIGVSDHGGWAVLVTVARDGTLLDRRRVELVDERLPKIPHHSEGQRLPLDEAVELVERVRVSAERHAVLALDAVAMAVPRILGVVVMGKLRQALVHKFYATAVEERPIARHRHQHRPTAVIRYPDDAAVLRHDVSSHLTSPLSGLGVSGLTAESSPLTVTA